MEKIHPHFCLICLLTFWPAAHNCARPEFCQDGRLHKFSPQTLCILTIDFYPEMVYTIIKGKGIDVMISPVVIITGMILSIGFILSIGG